MITEKIGDCLSLTSGILVHGCNCQGDMGGGIAKLIRDKWPSVYRGYRSVYQTSGLPLGSIVTVGGSASAHVDAFNRYVNFAEDELPSDLLVVNAMTQFTYGRDPNKVYVDYDALEVAFMQVRLLAKATGLPVHFPLIGCGLANGSWDIVSERIERALGPDVEKVLWRLPS